MATWSQEAAIHLRTLRDGLEDARRRLRSAAESDWVSVAADGYRDRLARIETTLDDLLAEDDARRAAVLGHTNAADACTRAGSACP